ncbi:hypothetical protein J6590_095068 [Homalodisca vitripennis]|nr:hypothetical protein J6590_095068 [Homalodisca vitripennis]
MIQLHISEGGGCRLIRNPRNEVMDCGIRIELAVELRCSLAHNRRQLTSMFDSCNLTILPLEPTHHTAESDTLLDLMVVSEPQDIVLHAQLVVKVSVRKKWRTT